MLSKEPITLKLLNQCKVLVTLFILTISSYFLAPLLPACPKFLFKSQVGPEELAGCLGLPGEICENDFRRQVPIQSAWVCFTVHPLLELLFFFFEKSQPFGRAYDFSWTTTASCVNHSPAFASQSEQITTPPPKDGNYCPGLSSVSFPLSSCYRMNTEYYGALLHGYKCNSSSIYKQCLIGCSLLSVFSLNHRTIYYSIQSQHNAKHASLLKLQS